MVAESLDIMATEDVKLRRVLYVRDARTAYISG